MVISKLWLLETFDSFKTLGYSICKLQSLVFCLCFFITKNLKQYVSNFFFYARVLSDLASLVYQSLSSFCHTCLYCIIATTITIID